MIRSDQFVLHLKYCWLGGIGWRKHPRVFYRFLHCARYIAIFSRRSWFSNDLVSDGECLTLISAQVFAFIYVCWMHWEIWGKITGREYNYKSCLSYLFNKTIVYTENTALGINCKLMCKYLGWGSDMLFAGLSFTDWPSDVAKQLPGDGLTYLCRFVAVNRGAHILLIAFKTVKYFIAIFLWGTLTCN